MLGGEKKMKIWDIVVISGVIGLMILSGCTTPSDKLGGVEDIKTNAIEAAANVNSYTYTMTTSTTDPTDDNGELATVTATGAIDITNGKIMTESTIPGTAGAADTTSYVYIIDNVMYSGTETGGITTWTKSNVTDLSSYDQVESQTKLMEYPNIERKNDETVEGVDCYVLEIIPDLDNPSLLPEEYASLGEMLTEFEVKQWIAKDTYYQKKTYMKMTINMFGMSVTSEVTMIVSNYNEPVTIELPEGAENAQWAPDFGF